MKRVYRAKETWTRIIAECRASSLSDAEWCRQNGIKISTFYATVKKFKKEGIEIPAKSGKGGFIESERALPGESGNSSRASGEAMGAGEIRILQNPVKKDAVDRHSGSYAFENPYAMEIEVGDFKVRVNNDTDPRLVAEMIGVLKNEG